jgi:hypothetical protein
MPSTPKGCSEKNPPKDLPGVIKEKDEIIKAARDRITTVTLNQPSAEHVLESLKACRIAHFTYHGTSQWADPTEEQQRNTCGGYQHAAELGAVCPIHRVLPSLLLVAPMPPHRFQ